MEKGKKNLSKQLVDVLLRTIEWNPTRESGWLSGDSQKLNHVTLQMVSGNCFSNFYTTEMCETTLKKTI